MADDTKKHICAGLLAHVDAGKTTLSEAMLYSCGVIRELGRVDHGDAFLDTNPMERQRGITIFSKQAVLQNGNLRMTLLDTPGHVDFSAEMERTLQVLDYAVLVISGTDGVQGHTRTLWKLLERYQIPTFVFVNKMDQPGTERSAVLEKLQKELSQNCVDFGEENASVLYEEAAVCEETLLEEFLETGEISVKSLGLSIARREIFPCYFGAALYMDGVDALLQGMERYAICPQYGTEFGARVYKILRDAKGNRLTCLKVLGGALRVKDALTYTGRKTPGVETRDAIREKADQLRIYSGEKFTLAECVNAGEICAVAGLSQTYPGQGIGCIAIAADPVLEPVLTYQVRLPQDTSAAEFLPCLRLLEEEDPMLRVLWEEELQELQVQVMGEVQLEILQALITQRFGVSVSFGEGRIVYKETIADAVEGVGHFEPLRHYAEVHLLLEPGEEGSGLLFLCDCREEQLDQNWQRLILTHLEEETPRGVLTGAVLTDVRITVVGGRAHLKHTEGGDFRQATYRAVRQGLMQAQSVLLEPYYDFVLEVPTDAVGRAMTDLNRREVQISAPEIAETAVLRGRGPVAALRGYAREVASYTRGEGKLSCVVGGYGPCHNTQEVVEQIGYDPYQDISHPAGSIFCSHGSGFYVEWDEVPKYMHVESIWKERPEVLPTQEGDVHRPARREKTEEWIGVDEVDAILERTYHANRRREFVPHKGISHPNKRTAIPAQTRSYGKNARSAVPGKKYLLVDGYNIIFAWDELREIAAHNIDSARGRLMDLLCDYQGVKQCSLIVVFDAYRVPGHQTETLDYHNIHVVYTKEAETADQFIEKFAHENGRKDEVTVATSDGLEQIIIRGQGCGLISAHEFEKEVAYVKRQVKQQLGEQKQGADTLFDRLSEADKAQILCAEQQNEDMQDLQRKRGTGRWNEKN